MILTIREDLHAKEGHPIIVAHPTDAKKLRKYLKKDTRFVPIQNPGSPDT